jgi:hypothetical protein
MFTESVLWTRPRHQLRRESRPVFTPCSRQPRRTSLPSERFSSPSCKPIDCPSMTENKSSPATTQWAIRKYLASTVGYALVTLFCAALGLFASYYINCGTTCAFGSVFDKFHSRALAICIFTFPYIWFYFFSRERMLDHKKPPASPQMHLFMRFSPLLVAVALICIFFLLVFTLMSSTRLAAFYTTALGLALLPFSALWGTQYACIYSGDAAQFAKAHFACCGS